MSVLLYMDSSVSRKYLEIALMSGKIGWTETFLEYIKRSLIIQRRNQTNYSPLSPFFILIIM